MEIEQLITEPGTRQHLPLDSTGCADEERINVRLQLSHGAGDGEAGIEMSAGSAAGEEDAHPYARSNTNDGSVALPPMTFSRVLPMFTRIAVMSMDRTRFDRP